MSESEFSPGGRDHPKGDSEVAADEKSESISFRQIK